MVTVLELNKALSDLEKVAIGLIRCKVNVKDEAGVWSNLLLGWKHLEWVFDKLLSGLVENWK